MNDGPRTNKRPLQIYETFKRLIYAKVWPEGIHIFTDHKIVLFTVDPLSAKLTIAQHVKNIKSYKMGLTSQYIQLLVEFTEE